MAALRSLRPDIAILSESACPEQLRRKLPELADVPMLWVGDNVHKGLAVVSFTGSELALDQSHRTTNQYNRASSGNRSEIFPLACGGTIMIAKRVEPTTRAAASRSMIVLIGAD